MRVSFDGERDLVDRRAAAHLLRVSQMTIRRWCEPARHPEPGPDGAVMYDLEMAAPLVAHVRTRRRRSMTSQGQNVSAI